MNYLKVLDLDLDLDYFLDVPVNNRCHASDERVADYDCVKSVWSEERVRFFIENNLGLSKDNRVKGRIVKGHNESLFFWQDLIEDRRLTTPFSVVHIDSHADMGCGSMGLIFVLDELIFCPQNIRPRCCSNFEVNGRFYDIDIGDYLLFAIAFGWIADITYCANPNNYPGDIPLQILRQKLPNYKFEIPITTTVKLRPLELEQQNKVNEPEVLLRILPKIENVNYDGDFTYVVLAQSPNYTLLITVIKCTKITLKKCTTNL